MLIHRGGTDAKVRFRARHGQAPPDFLVISPGKACNLRCQGCYATSGVHREKQSWSNFERLVAEADPARPIILLDHQPFGLEEAVEAGVSLQLSGHTHHGQLWPLGSITARVYEIDWGHLRKGATHIYVSCGVGTWGPPLRTSCRPEIVRLRLTVPAAAKS